MSVFISPLRFPLYIPLQYSSRKNLDATIELEESTRERTVIFGISELRRNSDRVNKRIYIHFHRILTNGQWAAKVDVTRWICAASGWRRALSFTFDTSWRAFHSSLHPDARLLGPVERTVTALSVPLISRRASINFPAIVSFFTLTYIVTIGGIFNYPSF